MTDSRSAVLARIRGALVDTPDPAPETDVDRNYQEAHVHGPAEALVDLLADNLTDYRAVVHRCTDDELTPLLARLLRSRGARTVAVPPGLPATWLVGAEVEQVHDDGSLDARRLDSTDSVITGCAIAIAETGTIVLDCGPGQGRRVLTLVPDHHICVVRADQVVASVPQAMPRLDPRRPQTWISGPSATSDIELDRVEGVHGPRTLEVVIVE